MSDHARLAHRALVRVGGVEARGFLDRIVTARLADLAPGRAVSGALLTPQGKVLEELYVHEGADGAILLDVFEGLRDDLLKRLKLYRLRAPVSLDDVSADFAATSRLGTGAILDPAVPAAARGFAPRSEAPEPAPPDAYHAARIGLGWPEQGLDYGAEAVFASDVNLDLLGGVDFQKGCFVGQEVASRMKRRGTARRRTVILEADGPIPMGEVRAGEDELGAVSSTAGSLALARVRLDRWAEAGDAAVHVEDVAVRIRRPAVLPVEPGVGAAGAGEAG